MPFGLNSVVAIAAGGYHSLALKSDGTVVAWGANDYGQSTVPGGLSNVVAIAAGGCHSLALKSDGTVVAWGSNLAEGESPLCNQSTVPVGLSKVVAIAAGGDTSMAVVASAVASPTLRATLSGNNFILSWPASAQNFSLQATTNLTVAGSWTTLTNVPVIVNEQNTVTDSFLGRQRFYRLKQ